MSENQIVKPLHFGMLKRFVPAAKELVKIDPKFENPFPSWIGDNNRIRKGPQFYTKEFRSKLEYYGISPKLFARFLKKESHVTLYELHALADLIDCKLCIILEKK